ncbi:unnamed protein product [Lactuca saligna]|uniref:Uncharacterized protein n=1 Tax=Lactuca saligna TaxID=75948 RepID=A0AA35YEP9_LACSI|nr:unnamed protein product [Lactuca saligna]
MSTIDKGDDGQYYYSITHISIFHICTPDIEIFGDNNITHLSSPPPSLTHAPSDFVLNFLKINALRYTVISIDISSRTLGFLWSTQVLVDRKHLSCPTCDTILTKIISAQSWLATTHLYGTIHIQPFSRSRFLLDDSAVDTDELSLDETYGDKQQPNELMQEQENFTYSYDNLKDHDPLAANRIHPNDHRKIIQYLHLYASSGVLPSKYLQEKTMEVGISYSSKTILE